VLVGNKERRMKEKKRARKEKGRKKQADSIIERKIKINEGKERKKSMDSVC
jgi:hypothetical protein